MAKRGRPAKYTAAEKKYIKKLRNAMYYLRKKIVRLNVERESAITDYIVARDNIVGPAIPLKRVRDKVPKGGTGKDGAYEMGNAGVFDDPEYYTEDFRLLLDDWGFKDVADDIALAKGYDVVDVYKAKIRLAEMTRESKRVDKIDADIADAEFRLKEAMSLYERYLK